MPTLSQLGLTTELTISAAMNTSEQKMRPEVLSYGFAFPNLVRDSAPGLGAEEPDHRFEDAPDDHEGAQDADGKINGGNGPIKERHVLEITPATSKCARV